MCSLDIYFDDDYGKLYEEVEQGKAVVLKFKCEFGEIKHQFIKRKIPIKLDEEKTYFDIVTPYGYGGPLIERCKVGKREELIFQFNMEFQRYCKENNVVSEFIRFHPIINNVEDFRMMYDVKHIRNTIETNIRDYKDVIQSQFGKGCRKNIRQALNKGVTYRVTESPDDIGNFKEIYYSTMNRNHAQEYYYFDDKYFEKCLYLFKNNIILVEAIFENKVIAAGFYFVYNKIIHIHLSGTLSEYLYLSPAYILRYGVTLWGKEHGYELIHHGGGRSNSLDDSLYKFKKQFSKDEELKFCVGKKIWNQEIYEMLCEITGQDKEILFFPAYRA